MTTITEGYGQNVDWTVGNLTNTTENSTTHRLVIQDYHVTISITYASSALTNYPIQVSIDTATLIAAGQMQSNGNDIRFYDADETTLLTHWVQTPTINTAATLIWVKVPSISGNKSIFMHYGNLSASNVESITGVFTFADDFSTNLSAWTGNTADFSVTGGELTQTGTASKLISHDVALANTVVAARIQINLGTATDFRWGLQCRIDASNRVIFCRRQATAAGKIRVWGDGTTYYSGASPQWTDGVYGIDQIIIGATVAASTFSFNGTTVTGVTDFGSNIANGIGFLNGTSNGAPGTQKVDWVYVRPYHSPEPTNSASAGSITALGTHSIIMDLGAGISANTIAWSAIEDPTVGAGTVEINTVQYANPRTVSIRGSNTAPSGSVIGTFNDSDTVSHNYWLSWGSTSPSAWEEIASGASVSTTTYRYVEIRETLRNNN